MRYDVVAYVVGILLGLSYLIYSLYFGVESVDTLLGHLVQFILLFAVILHLYKTSRSK